MRGIGEFGRPKRAAFACCLVGLVALGALGGVAGAGKKLKTSSGTTNVPAATTGAVTAECKPGTRGASGGYEAELGSVGDGPVFIPIDSLRDGGRNWRVSAQNYLGDNEGSLTSYVYCRDQKVISSTESTTSAEETPTVVATCPAGMKAVSGGFDGSFDDSTIIPYMSRKLGKRQWEVTYLQEDSGPLVSQVNCHEGKPLNTEQATETITAVDDDFTATAVASCSRRQRVVSGGFALEETPDIGGPFAYESQKQGKRAWRVSSFSVIETDLTAYAYCEKKKKKRK